MPFVAAERRTPRRSLPSSACGHDVPTTSRPGGPRRSHGLRDSLSRCRPEPASATLSRARDKYATPSSVSDDAGHGRGPAGKCRAAYLGICMESNGSHENSGFPCYPVRASARLLPSADANKTCVLSICCETSRIHGGARNACRYNPVGWEGALPARGGPRTIPRRDAKLRASPTPPQTASSAAARTCPRPRSTGRPGSAAATPGTQWPSR